VLEGSFGAISTRLKVLTLTVRRLRPARHSSLAALFVRNAQKRRSLGAPRSTSSL